MVQSFDMRRDAYRMPGLYYLVPVNTGRPHERQACSRTELWQFIY